jgi:hypothetical protein
MVIMLIALWLAAPGMVAFEGTVEQRLRLGAAELNAKAPFDDGVAVLVRATARKRNLALQYRVAANADVGAARRSLVQRSCTDHPIRELISDSEVVVTAVLARRGGNWSAVRIDKRTCRIWWNAPGSAD